MHASYLVRLSQNLSVSLRQSGWHATGIFITQIKKGGGHNTTEEVTIVPTELRERVIMVPNSVAQKRIKLPISGRRPMSIIYYAGNLFS